MAADPLDGVRPGAGRRSWWLRDALALESPELRAASPPLTGPPAPADIVIIGGGYTGLWTAWHLTELEPSVRIRLVEQDICGGGPSGRNGGFLTGWWDELPTLIERYGEDEAVRVARAVDGAVDAVGEWCTANGVEAWYRKDGFLQVSAAAAQDGGWDEAVEACRRLGVGDEYVSLTADEVAARVRSPVFRAGVFMRGAGTIQPARLARGLRRVLLERGVGVHERTRWNGERAPGEQVVIAQGAWAPRLDRVGARLVTWSSYIVMTEPIPDRLAELGWTGGEGIADARFTLHYARTTPDGRIVLGGGGGRAGTKPGGAAFTSDTGSAARAALGLRRWFPSLATVRIEDAWGGPIDITSDHLPFFGSVAGTTHFGYGYSGNGVAPSWLGGRILAGLVLARTDEFTSLPLVGRRPRRFPPEPLRSIGARVVREAIVRREQAEESGERPNRLIREVSRLPRRMGYHLGPSN